MRDKKPLVTLKTTKRTNLPVRTETVFGLDLMKYLGFSDLSGFKGWHHSRTAVDRESLSHEEKGKVKYILKFLIHVLHKQLLQE